MRTNFIALYLAPFLALGFSLPEEPADLNSLFNYDELIQEKSDYSDANYITIENNKNSVDIESLCKVIPTGVIFIKQEDVTIDCNSLNNPVTRIKRQEVAPEEGSGDESEDEPSGITPAEEVKQPPLESIHGESTIPKQDEEEEEEDSEFIPSRSTAFSSEIVTIEAAPPTEAPEREEVEPNLHTTSSDFVQNFHPKEKIESGDTKSIFGPNQANNGDTKSMSEQNQANNVSDVGAMENSSKTSKDTKILIFLFVAVVAVGVAAFGYNFIKKRKQRNSEVEDASNTVKISSNNRGEEEMKEMKPLMEKVDLVDEKEQSNRAGASTSDNNNPSSSDVKT